MKAILAFLLVHTLLASTLHTIATRALGTHRPDMCREDFLHVLPKELKQNNSKIEARTVLTQCREEFIKTFHYIDTVFEKYGFSNTLPFEGLEHLLENIHLSRLAFDHQVQVHVANHTRFYNLHQGPAHSSRQIQSSDCNHHHGTKDSGDHDEEADDDDTGDDHDHEHAHMNEKRSPVSHSHSRRKREIEADDNGPWNMSMQCLSPEEIMNSFLFREDSGISKVQFMQICPALILQIESHSCQKTMGEPVKSGANRKSWQVWLYGCVSILVISVAGLLVVSLVALMKTADIGSVLHFLVAMAIGALTGDAFLHLIPHSLAGHNHASNLPVYKGLCGVGVFVVFFLMSRLQILLHHAKTRKKLKTASKGNKPEHLNSEELLGNNPDGNHFELYDDTKHCGKEGNVDVETSPHDGRQCLYQEKTQLEEEHQPDSAHNHGHAHSVGGSVGGLVWRVIAGDGIHNLCDGLAIGVAYTSSITSGMSTTIAVLCHELPHETGDFAVLLKKGMSVKSAVLFNCLSSLLSLTGLLMGIGIGNFQQANAFILLGVAAMFVYISLVDMLPEMNVHGSHVGRTVALQVLGLCVGYAIMLTIALKERQLKSLLSGNN